MVQIDPPTGPAESPAAAPPAWQPQIAVGSSSIDSEAITEDAIAPADFSAAELGGSVDSPALDAARDTAHAPAPPFSGQVPPTGDGPTGIPPQQSWQSEKTTRSRQIALIATLSATGMLIAIAVFGWFVSSWRARSEATNDAIAHVDTLDVDSSATDSTEFNSTESESPDSPTVDTEVVEPAVSPDSPDRSNGLTDSAPGDEPSETESAVTPPVEPSSEQTAGASIPVDLIPDSPLATPPADLDLPSPPAPHPPSATDDPDGGKSDPPANPGSTTLPPEFAKYTQILPPDGALIQPNLDTPPSIDDIELDEAASEDEFELAGTRPRQLDLRRDLGIRLALSSKGYPLADLLLVIGQVTTVPMELDWISMDLAGIDVAGSVTPPTGVKTAQALIDELAAQLDCQWIDQETLLLLSPTDQRMAAEVTRLTNLDDFAEGRATAESTLIQFLHPAADPAPKVFQVGAERDQQQWAALAVESLRRMRSIEPLVPDDRLGRWVVLANSPQLTWRPLAAGETGPQIDAPISVGGFLLDIARRNGATCLINWHDLNRRGVGPDTMHFPPIKADAATTLRDALARWRVEVRAVDSTHWWIGNRATYDQLPVLVWTPPLGDHRALVQERMQITQAAHPDADVRIVIDPVSDRALMKLPRYIARQVDKIIPAP